MYLVEIASDERLPWICFLYFNLSMNMSFLFFVLLKFSCAENLYIYIYIYNAVFYVHKIIIIIIIIVMSYSQHGYPWSSLATSPYRSSLLAGLQGYISYPHRAAVCTFELVVYGSTSLMSTSLLLQLCPACLVRLTWIVFMMAGR